MITHTRQQHFFVVASIAICSLLAVQVRLFGDEKADAKAKETPEERREGIVFQAIADMIANRDQLLNRYAVILEGEFTDLEADEPRVHPMLVIRCVSKKHQYDYAAQVDFQPQLRFDDQEAIAGIRNLENWQECVQCRGDYKAFNGPKRLGEDYRHVGKGEDAVKAMREMGLVVPRFDPFDDFVAFSSMMLNRDSNLGSAESLLLHRTVLKTTDELIGSRIKCMFEFHQRTKESPQNLVMTLAQANAYMPIDVIYQFLQPQMFSHMRLSWRKHNKNLLLPWQIEFANPVHVGSKIKTDQYAFKLRWLVGDELPDSVFDFKADPRDPLMKLFGIDYEKDGQPAKNPWKVPEDLYQFDESKQK
jgi:hypothetical protein